MLQCFTDYFSKEENDGKGNRYEFQNIDSIVKKYFEKEYGYAGTENVCADEAFEAMMCSFLIVTFKWAKEFDNPDTYDKCFGYLLSLLNDVCNLKEKQVEELEKLLVEIADGDIEILQRAEDCYWTMIAFNVAQKLAHDYLTDKKKNCELQDFEIEEFAEDMMAYGIVLKILMNENGVLKKSTYLAPVIYIDFFDLYYYTDKILYKTVLGGQQYSDLMKQKNKLFSVVNKEEVILDTRDGDRLYGEFLDMYREYRNQLLFQVETGRLDQMLAKGYGDVGDEFLT